MTEKLPDISTYELKMPVEGTIVSEPTTSKVNTMYVLITLIVLLLVVLGGLLAWSMNVFTLESPEPTVTESPVTRPTIEENNEPESTTVEAEVETQQAISTSDEIFTIQADLESTATDDLTKEFTTIEQALGL